MATIVVTWTVLQHVDERVIDEATNDLERVLSPGGTLVCCERVRPPSDDHIWPRSVETYDRLLGGLECVDVSDRTVEPTWADAMETERPAEQVLVFQSRS